MTYRPIVALPVPADVEPNQPETAPPEVLWVSPACLLVDDRYQRDLSRRSVELIMRVVSDFDWRRFKPPVVVRASDSPDHFDIIDGQHTAIAAATHGGIEKIPVLLISAEAIEARAKAFLGHNRDRVAMQATQLFHAAVAAGDEDALTIKQVCDRAGVKILRLPPPRGVFRSNETMAISVLSRIVANRTAMKARIVVETCAQSGAAPITADMLRAVDELLNGRDYAGQLAPEALALTLKKMSEFQPRIEELALARKMPKWRAAVVVLFQNTRKIRGQ